MREFLRELTFNVELNTTDRICSHRVCLPCFPRRQGSPPADNPTFREPARYTASASLDTLPSINNQSLQSDDDVP